MPPESTPFADALRAWRDGHKWTRQQAADYLGVSERTLEGWERGRSAGPAEGPVRRMMDISSTRDASACR